MKLLQTMLESQELSQNSDRHRISGSIRISPRQKGNPVLKHIRKVPWEWEEGLVADFILGESCVALYLSVRYFTLQPEYIHERIKLLGRGQRLRVLLVQVDVKVRCFKTNRCYNTSMLFHHYTNWLIS